MPRNRTIVQQPRARLISALIASCFTAAVANANPVGPSVVSGQASFAASGKSLTVTNSANAIIHWQGFSIGAGEITRFQQQSAASAVLNRVVGQDPSAILGTLSSNGRVYLVNPNGILFGQGSRVDVAGLVASTLNISNQDFMLGRLNFEAGAVANSIVNQGDIVTASGGRVLLIAPDVQNHGLISSPQGEVVLAAGKSVQLVEADLPMLKVEVQAGGEALNVGQILAAGGRIGVYAGLINQRGVVRADAASVDASGKIVFRSSDTTLLESGSVTSVAGAKGGEIQVLGNKVGLTGNARVDASGEAGGGTVLIGGDYQGRNAEVTNAFRTYVGPETSIQADALVDGDGGKVIVWSDDATRAYGTIGARGGAQSGNGGLVEVSGKNWLEFGGMVDTRAPNGHAGSLLLDPMYVQIVSGSDAFASGAGFNGGNPDNVFSGGTDQSQISWTTIKNLLTTTPAGGTNVIITTTGNCSASGSCGDIDIINASPDLAASKTLRLLAHSDINVNGSVTNTGSGTLEMYAGWTGASTSAPTVGSSGSIVLNQPITIAGTAVLATGNSITQTVSAAITADKLSARAGGQVALDTAVNMVNTVAGAADDCCGTRFNFKNGRALSVGSVAGTDGIFVDDSDGTPAINLSVTSGTLSIDRPITAQFGPITIVGAGAVNINSDVKSLQSSAGPIQITGSSVTVGSGVAVSATPSFGNASVGMTATGGAITLSSGSTISAIGADELFAAGGTAGVTLTATGGITGSGSILAQGGQGSDSPASAGGAADLIVLAGGAIDLSGSTVTATGGTGLGGNGTGTVTVKVGTASGNATPSGDITVHNITADNVELQQNSFTARKGIKRAGATSLIAATQVLMEIDHPDSITTGGAIGTSSEPMRIQTARLEAHTHEPSPGVFIESPNAGNLQLGGVSFFSGGVKGVQAVGGGDIEIAVNGTLTTLSGTPTATCGAGIGGPICTTLGNVALRANDMSLGNSVNGGTGNVSLAPYATNRNILIGTGGAGGILELSTTELQQATAGTLKVGRSDGIGALTVGSAIASSDVNAGTLHLAHQNIALDAAVNLGAGGETLVLDATGSVTQTAAVTASVLDLRGSGGNHALTNAANQVGELRMDTGVVTFAGTGGTIIAGTPDLAAGKELLVSPSTPTTSEGFGNAIVVHGNLMVVGAQGPFRSGAGSAYIYRWNGSAWVFEAKLTAPSTLNFGWAVAAEGTHVVVGAPESDVGGVFRAGATFAFEYSGGSWGSGVSLPATNRVFESVFGTSMGISNNRLVVGGLGRTSEGGFWTGKVWFYDFVSGAWVERGRATQSDPQANDYFGASLDISGNRMIVGAFNTNASNPGSPGKAYIFEFNPTTRVWTQSQKLTQTGGAVTDRFGESVSISGDVAIVGAPYADPGGKVDGGSLYLFRYSGGTWVQEQVLTPADVATSDRFGISTRIRDGVILAGSYLADLPGFVNAGAAYLYTHNGAQWVQDSKLTATSPVASDLFGFGVYLSDRRVFVGATGADGGATNAGALYTYGPLSTLGGALTANVSGAITQSGAVTAGGAVNYTSGTTIAVNATLNAAASAVTLKAGTATQTSPITASALELLGAGGSHTLTNASNAVGTLAASTGSVDFANSGSFNVGTAGATTGITASGNVSLSPLNGGQTTLLAGIGLGSGSTLTLNGATSWPSGTTIAGAGEGVSSVVIPSASSLAVSGAVSHGLSGVTLSNAGTVNWSAGDINLSGATINNQSGATWNILTTGSGDDLLGSGTFNNLAGGTVVANAPGGSNSLHPTTVNHAGNLNLLQGDLDFDGSVAVNFTGAITLANGTRIKPYAGAGTPTLNFGAGASISVPAGSAELRQDVASTLNFNTDVILPAALTLTHAAGTIGGTGTLTVNGPYAWTGGTLTGTGTTVMTSASNLSTSGAGAKVMSGGRTLNIAGDAQWAGGAAIDMQNATVNLLSGALFDVQADGRFFDATSGAGANTINVLAGATLRKSAGAGLSEQFGSAAAQNLNNDGIVEVQTGTLQFAGAAHSGTFNVSPGASFNFHGGANALQDGATFTGGGTAGFVAGAGGGLSMAATGSGVSLASGTTLQLSGIAVGGSGNLSNQGILNLASASLPGLVSNTGTINVAGSSAIAGGVHQSGGTTAVPAAQTLTVGGAGFTLTGGTLSGAGTILGNVTNDGGTVIPGSSAGILTVEGDYTQAAGGSLTMEIGGTVAGSEYDRLAVTGTVSLGGTLNVLEGAVAPVPGTTYVLITCGACSGNFSVVSAQYLNVTPIYGTTGFTLPFVSFVNPWTGGIAGAWEDAANWGRGAVPSANDDVEVIFVPGPTNVTISGGTQTARSVVANGNLTLAGGSLNLAAPSTVDGTLTLSGGTLTGAGTLAVSQLNWTAGTIGAGGAITVGSGGATLTNASAVILDGRSMTVNGPFTMAGTNWLDMYNGAVLTVNGLATLDTSNISSSFFGINTFGAPATVNYAGGITKTGALPFDQVATANTQGTVQSQQGELVFDTPNGGTHSGTSFVAASGALIKIANGAHLASGNVTFSGAGITQLGNNDGVRTMSFAPSGGTLTNNGTLNVVPGATLGALTNQGTLNLTSVPLSGLLTNTGAVNVDGSVSASGGIQQNGGLITVPLGQTLGVGGSGLVLAGGTLSGNGTISGNVDNQAGIVSPGASPGHLTIAGNYTQGPSGTLLAQVGGTIQGVDYDWLEVSGTATLDGALQVAAAPLAPIPGVNYSVITCGTCVGQFSSGVLPLDAAVTGAIASNAATVVNVSLPSASSPAVVTQTLGEIILQTTTEPFEEPLAQQIEDIQSLALGLAATEGGALEKKIPSCM